MYKYILLVMIIIFIGSFLFINSGPELQNKLVKFYAKKVTGENVANSNDLSQERYQRQMNESFFDWFIRESVEINSWNYYKKTFLTNEGRVVDHQRGGVTTSEGQAYAMRRAIMIGDKATFDKLYDWTNSNLKHNNDNLFAWLWGPKIKKKRGKIEYGVLDPNGATDAGAEIALSLLFAAKVWQQESYKTDALKIINDIWNKETINIKGERIIITGVNQNRGEIVEINPSYFLLHSFRIFAEEDPKHDWQKVVDSSYRLTNYCIDNIKSGLPPDFFYMDRYTGEIFFNEEKSDFSYDAVRVFYRFYIDYTITNDPRATKLLSRSKFFIERWKNDGAFYTNYKQDGELKDYHEYIGAIAVILPAIKMYDKKIANEIYHKKIKSQYNNQGYWGDPKNYYAQNLVWFGNWLYQNEENVRLFVY